MIQDTIFTVSIFQRSCDICVNNQAQQQNIWMSNSNHKAEYAADKCQQAEQPAALNFFKDKED